MTIAAFDHLDHSEKTAPIHELSIDERLFQRKDQRPQSIRHIVSQAAEHRHGRVRVGVDEAWHDDAAARIDGFGGLVAGGDRRGSDSDDLRALDDHGPVFQHLPTVVHRHDVGVGDDQVSGCRLGAGGATAQRARAGCKHNSGD